MSRSTTGFLALLCALLFSAGCADDNPMSMAPPITCTPGAVGCAQPPMAGVTGVTGGATVAPPLAGVGNAGVSGAAVGPAGMTAPAPAAGGVPCAVAEIVTNKCTGCHQTTPKIGAPMPLMTHADFHAAAYTDKSKKIYEVIPTRLDPVDPAKRMPAPPLEGLTMPEKQTFNMWLSAGAPAMTGSAACPITIKEIGAVQEPEPPGTVAPGGGSGGAHVTPIEYNDPEMKCYKFQTHARGDKTKPWVQPGGSEQYINFDFKAPWEGTQYLRASKIANDPNSKVMHHWLLFKLNAPVTDGAATAGSGIHPGGTLVHAWGPGASPIYLDPDVGVALESTVGYQLEAHFNGTGGGGEDMSGAEICVTPKKPEKLAELVWVGSDSIAGTSATGRCAPRGPFPIKIIAAQPHMHKLGSHMKVTVNRAGGMSEVIHDEAFAFDSQIYYKMDVTLNQGDSMTTTCSYSGFASFGTSTTSEMCYFFSLAWPAGSLRAGSSFIHGPATCM
jgi:hypothetical protein